MKIKWKEVFKFLSGATFVGAGTNAYLSINGISISFLGFTFSPELLGIRALVGLVLFLLFFYFGYLKK